MEYENTLLIIGISTCWESGTTPTNNQKSTFKITWKSLISLPRKSVSTEKDLDMITELTNTMTQIQERVDNIINAGRILEPTDWNDDDYAEQNSASGTVEYESRAIMHDLNELKKMTEVSTVAFQEKG